MGFLTLQSTKATSNPVIDTPYDQEVKTALLGLLDVGFVGSSLNACLNYYEAECRRLKALPAEREFDGVFALQHDDVFDVFKLSASSKTRMLPRHSARDAIAAECKRFCN